jgi:NAD(P)-dependent dehydrogenase (short-subunit alcohol dehydrogenase family)
MTGLQEVSVRVAVVTGGASGIGKGIARQLIGEGMQVVIADIEDDALSATADAIGAIGIHADVGDLSEVRARPTPPTGGSARRKPALTHPDWYPMVERRHQAIAAAFRDARAALR